MRETGYMSNNNTKTPIEMIQEGMANLEVEDMAEAVRVIADHALAVHESLEDCDPTNRTWLDFANALYIAQRNLERKAFGR